MRRRRERRNRGIRAGRRSDDQNLAIGGRVPCVPPSLCVGHEPVESHEQPNEHERDTECTEEDGCAAGLRAGYPGDSDEEDAEWDLDQVGHREPYPGRCTPGPDETFVRQSLTDVDWIDHELIPPGLSGYGSSSARVGQRPHQTLPRFGHS